MLWKLISTSSHKKLDSDQTIPDNLGPIFDYYYQIT